MFLSLHPAIPTIFVRPLARLLLSFIPCGRRLFSLLLFCIFHLITSVIFTLNSFYIIKFGDKISVNKRDTTMSKAFFIEKIDGILG